MKYFFPHYLSALPHQLDAIFQSKGWQRTDYPQTAQITDSHFKLPNRHFAQLEGKHYFAKLAQSHDLAHPITFYLNPQLGLNTLPEAVMDSLTAHSADTHYDWILKPAWLNNGESIALIDSYESLMRHLTADLSIGDWVLQQYINQPYCFEGHKYTTRVTVVVSTTLGVYLAWPGYANISEKHYEQSDTSPATHLTNYLLGGTKQAIEQRSLDEMPSEVALSDYCQPLKQLFMAMDSSYPGWRQSDQPHVELIGVDFIRDASGQLYCLEMNVAPDFPMSDNHPLMAQVWNPFWQRFVADFVEPMAAAQGLAGQGQFADKMTGRNDRSSLNSAQWHQLLPPC